MRKLVILAMMMAGLAACTKAKPYKEVGKPDLGTTELLKSAVDTGADYIYVPSTVESSRTAAGSRPHWSADAKIVRFQFTEKALRVLEPDRDGRFADNPVNAGSVLSIPIEHVDYRCAQDDFGKCTQKEEKNEDLRWDKRSYFRLKPEELALQQVTFLPVEIATYFGSCFEEVGSEFIKAQMDQNSVNLILEKTYQAKLVPDAKEGDDNGCNPGAIENLKDLTFSVRVQHSFLKVGASVSPDYEPIRYTRADEGNFGYFSTQKLLLDVDNSDTENSESFYFDRWNPKRKTVVYYLSQAFNKPENASLKKATADAFAILNSSLKQAGAGFALELRDPVAGMSSGDIRNNMIVLEEDPQAAGVIGYGPHTSNPLTGEIVQAKTVMYLGTMKKYLKFNYEELIEEKLAALSEPVQMKKGQPALVLSAELAAKAKGKASQAKSATAASVKALSLHSVRVPGGLKGALDVNALRELATSSSRDRTFAKDLREKMEFLSKNHCNYPAELFNFANAVDAGVDNVLKEVGLKPWLQLTEAEKEKVITALLPFVYMPTLIHEMGHNLGLRHNFAGSEDKDNFYTADELKKMGVKREFKYSSVMDYAYRTTNELRTMGKYDIAALRYAYAEKVELKDGKIVTLRELHANPALELRPYAYCTDEHVDANPNCSRFDEGTNMLEMANHWVHAYNERYHRSNVRAGRRNFSLLSDSGQIGAIDSMMGKLRLLFERYESIKNDFDLAADAPEWESIDFLKDLKSAAVVAGEFYLNVLKTPDVMCAVSLASKPNEVIAVVPIRVFSKRAISCFDTSNVQLNPQFAIVAEGGKSFTSRKDPNSDNAFADQIDVRGIWMDKLLAAHYLFGRELGSILFDKYTENFADMPEMQGAVVDTLGALITDEMAGPVDFRLPSGATVPLNISYQLYDATDANNSHKLPAVLDPAARAIFKLPNATTLFHQTVMKMIVAREKSDTNPDVARALLNVMSVYPSLPNDGRPEAYQALEIGGKRYFVRQDNVFGSILVQNLQVTQLLGSLTAEQLEKVIAATSDDGLTDVEKAARALGPDVLEKFQQGGFQKPAYYAMMIQSLAALN